MKLSTSRSVFGIALMALLIVLSVSFDAMGQGRGRRVSHWDKKCSKFVNCHDARDGRWDGRGPNRRVHHTSRYRRSRRHRDIDDMRNRRRQNDSARDRSWRRRLR
jgi:hypothetical protein